VLDSHHQKKKKKKRMLPCHEKSPPVKHVTKLCKASAAGEGAACGAVAAGPGAMAAGHQDCRSSSYSRKQG